MGCKVHQESSPLLEDKFRLWKLEGRIPKTSSWQGTSTVPSPPAGSVPPPNH